MKPSFCGFKNRLLHLLLDVDVKGARFVLMLSSALWAFFLLYPGDGFGRAIYLPMKLMAEDWVWGIFFAIHATATFVASFFCLRHKAFLFLEGLLGLGLYSFSTLSVLFSIDFPAPLFAPCIACTISSLWILVRYPEPVHVPSN